MVKRQSIAPGHLLDESGQVGKRVRLTRKTRPGASSHVRPDPGHPTPRRWKRLRSLPPPKEWGVRWASLAIFFLDLGLGEVLLWERLEPAFGWNRRRFFSGWSVQPKGPVRWALAHLINGRVRLNGQTILRYTTSAPPPPPPYDEEFVAVEGSGWRGRRESDSQPRCHLD